MVVKKDTYTLDLGGQTEEDFRKDRSQKKLGADYPLAPHVDLVLELRNTGTKELKIWMTGAFKDEKPRAGGDYLQLVLDLQGPGATKVLVTDVVKTPATPGPSVVTLAPGQVASLPITSLSFGQLGVAAYRLERAYWTRPGEYTLAATVKTAVAPAPEGAKGTSVDGFGTVSITSAPVRLKVVDASNGWEPTKADPAAARSDLGNFLPLVEAKDKSKLDDREREILPKILQKLEHSKVPTVKEAKQFAERYKFRTSGISATEAPYVVSLLSLGLDVPDFGKRGDPIWVVQFRELSPWGAINQEVWVSSSTGAVLGILPPKR
jgi:hypothetical protein